MFIKFFSILLLAITGLIITLILAFGEEFAEKLLPVFFVGIVIVYIFSSWYFGYFIATQRPPLLLIITAAVVIAVVGVSGYYMGAK
ncbi:MAG: hypothetical protein AAB525_02645 [Patescibacteria group bacterium]